MEVHVRTPTMLLWFDTVLVRFKAVTPRALTMVRLIKRLSYSCTIRGTVFVVNRTQSCHDWPRTPTNNNEFTHGTTRNEHDSATVVLRFRPFPQATTVRHECFKQFKPPDTLLNIYKRNSLSKRLLCMLILHSIKNIFSSY